MTLSLMLYHFTECHYVEWRVLITIMMSAIMLSVMAPRIEKPYDD
jgi:hypothetical protein